MVLLPWSEKAGWWLSSQPAAKLLRSGVRDSWHLTISMYKTLCNPQGAQIPYTDTQPHGEKRIAGRVTQEGGGSRVGSTPPL